jgi:hypothetical protein
VCKLLNRAGIKAQDSRASVFGSKPISDLA